MTMGKIFRTSILLLSVLLPLGLCHSLEVPLDFHGRGFFGKYLNSDTSRFNFDSSFEIYLTTLRHGPFSTYVYYRDDLDMAEQTGGVSIDPRYGHYYIVGGVDYFIKNYVITGYFVHDCIHDIDYEVEGTPVFNRFRLRFAPHDYHYATRLKTKEKLLWSIDIGYYPHWDFHGWDINAGADYNFDFSLTGMYNLVSTRDFGLDFVPDFTITAGDTSFYHRHVFGIEAYYTKSAKRFGLSLDYFAYVNDPLKSPNKLWLLSVYTEF